MVRAISLRRSRGAFQSAFIPQRRSTRRAWYLVLAVAACSAPKVPLGDPQAEIRAMLVRSAADWNRGDLAGFMGDYARDSMTSYVSGGHVQYGWQALYNHYRASYFTPGQARDFLRFEEIQLRPLTTDLAYCTARFRLPRGAAVTSTGPFPLLLQKCGHPWHILQDHPSSDPG